MSRYGISISSYRRPRLYPGRRIPAYPLGRLPDNWQQQRKIDPFFAAVISRQGIKMIREIIDEDGRQMKLQPGGIIRPLYLPGDGPCQGFQDLLVRR